MEQRHMQEKSRGAARPDVDARARAIQEQIIHIPRPAQPGNARPAAQSTAGHPSGAQQRPPQAARPRDDACAQRRRAAPAPAHTAPRGQAAGGRHYAAKPRKRRRAPGGGMFFACVAVVILSLSWVITTLIELPAKRAAASSLAALSASQAASSQADGSMAQTGEAVLGPVQQTDASYTQPSASLVALPEAGRVDMSYFDDALFIGDSLTRGFQEYSSGIPNAKYAAYLGAGPKQFMEGLVENISGQQVAAIDEILAAAPKKVYILLGTNSMATLTDEAFLKYYNDFLDFLLPQLPQDTVYYIQGIPPVSAEKMAGDENFSVESLADIFSLSRSSLQRKVKIISGTTPGEYLRNYRLKRACHLLLESNMRINEVAFEVGFNSASYFTKAFFKAYNMTPTDFLAEHAPEKADRQMQGTASGKSTDRN